MQYKEYRNVAQTTKESWGNGAWLTEPDKVQWQDPETGFACLAVRNDGGAWCGYVGVPSSHPLHNVYYDEVECVFDVHGGLTFTDFCSPNGKEERSICHKVEDGEDDNVWWFGFDCAHAGDLSPAYEYHRRTVLMPSMMQDPKYVELYERLKANPLYRDDIYRDLGYVKAEVASLAAQLRQYQIDGKSAPKMTETVAERHKRSMDALRAYSAKRKAAGDFEPMDGE